MVGKPRFSPLTRTLSVTAALLLGSAMGCSSDEYYCDANGCYFCDGLGCRAVTPPSRPTCAGDYQCPSSQVCTDLGCTVSCANDADCAQGWVCRAVSGSARGYCVSPTERTPTRNPGSCRSNTDCSGGAVCVDGTCARSTCDSATTSCPCTADTQCTGGQVCLGGRCAAPSTACRFNAQCGANRVCVNQACRAACSATAPCAAGQVCTDGVCVDQPAGQCVRDSECGAGRRCLNSTCYNRCASAADCGAGLYCSDEGVCLADTRRQPFCTSNAQCESGSECIDGVCRRPCTDNADCARTDVSYRNCAPLAYLGNTRRYCQTNNEVNSTCARQADCSSGQSCVDGVCRTN